MNLAEMRLEVLQGLNAEDDDFFPESRINKWLNEAIQTMCSIAQPLQTTFQFTTVANQREYAAEVPNDIDEIFAVFVHAGTSQQLEQTDFRYVHQGNRRAGTPRNFYTRRYAQQVAQSQSDGQITVSDIGQQPDFVLGLEPVPSSAMPITLYYFPKHYKLVADTDVPIAIPPEFHRGLIAYAIALGKEKEAALGEADRWRSVFGEYASRLRTKSIAKGVLAKFPTARIVDEDMPAFGSVRVYEAT